MKKWLKDLATWLVKLAAVVGSALTVVLLFKKKLVPEVKFETKPVGGDKKEAKKYKSLADKIEAAR